jgi:hypothetical protein
MTCLLQGIQSLVMLHQPSHTAQPPLRSDFDHPHTTTARTSSERLSFVSFFLHLLLPNRTETVGRVAAELKVAPTWRMVGEVERLFGNGVTSFL